MISGNLVDILDCDGCFMEYSDSMVFNSSPQQVFDVVADIEKYPEFLRGWMSVEILQREDNKLLVDQQLGFPFMNWNFVAEALLECPYHIHIQSSKSDFLNLVVDWHFSPLENSKTRVILNIKTSSEPGPQHRFLHGILTSSSTSILDSFRQRVEQQIAVTEIA